MASTTPFSTPTQGLTHRLILGPLQTSLRSDFLQTLETWVTTILWAECELSGASLSTINGYLNNRRIEWSPYIEQHVLAQLKLDLCQQHGANSLLSGSMNVSCYSDDPLTELTSDTLSDIEHIKLSWRLFDATQHDDDEREHWQLDFTLPAPTSLSLPFNPEYVETIITQVQAHTQAVFQALHIPHYTHPLSPDTLLFFTTLLSASPADDSDTTNNLTHLTQTDPDGLLGPLYLAKHHQQKGHFAKAATHYQTLGDRAPSSAPLKTWAYTLAGQNFALADNTEQAHHLWQSVLDTSPAHPQVALNLALDYEQQNNLIQALNLFTHHQQHHPNDLRAYFGLARIYSKQEDWPHALEQYEKQHRISPTDPWCLSNMATCHLQLNNEDQAVTYLKQAASLDPTGEAGQYAQLILMQFETAF